MTAALVHMKPDMFARHFDGAATARLRALCVIAEPLPCANLADMPVADGGAIKVVVTGWGSAPLDASTLDALPRLRLIAHAAGSVRGIIAPQLLEHGVRVVHGATANAKPVAEFTLAMILLANKRTLDWARIFHRDRDRFDGALRHADRSIGNYRRTIGIVGASRIGRALIDMLRPHDFTVLVSDPFAYRDEIAALGATLVPLPELLGASDVISLHLPLLPETRGAFGADQLAAMRDGALLINTARGAIVDGDALASELVSGRISAVLDVTDPEPLPADSPLWNLPNVVLTPHIAGSLGNEIRRMTDAVLDDIGRFLAGEPLQHEITLDRWDRTA